VESVFGSNPWVTNPSGVCPDGTLYSYNPIYFATGGTVVQNDQFTGTTGDPFHQSQSNNMVQLANGALVNPGLIASFYTHGYPQWMVNQMVSNEVAGATSAGT
jgi:predicted AlkP superfamily pyrophosphatase or phosphodiesterase